MSSWLTRLGLGRIADGFRRRQIAAQFEEEMQFHLEQLEEKYRGRGLGPEEARAAARREFGNVTQVREDLHWQAGWPGWENLWKDVAVSGRALMRRPVYSVSAVLVLGLSLGLAATIYALIDAVFLRPLAVPRPAELYLATEDPAAPGLMSRLTVARLEELAPGRTVGGYASNAGFTVQIDSRPASRVRGALVTGGLFEALDVGPQAGRLLGPDDDRAAAAPVVVVSETWARQEFGSPAAAVGRQIHLNREIVAIIGVVPASLRGLAVGERTDLWIPTALQPRLRYSGNAYILSGDDRPNDPDWNREARVEWLRVLVRARAGQPVGAGVVNQAFADEKAQLAAAFQDPSDREEILRRTWELTPAPGGYSSLRDDFRRTGSLLGGLVFAMLLLACANVSGGLLIRTIARHREVGIRLALGSSRWRVMRLSLIESVFLCVSGAAVGLVLSVWLLPVASRWLLPGQSLQASPMEGTTLLAVGFLTLFAAAASALGPAAWLLRLQPLTALTGAGGSGRAAVVLARGLVVVQLGLAVLLVSLSFALGAQIESLMRADHGFARDGVIAASFDPTTAGYTAETTEALLARIEAALRPVPGVKQVTFASSGLLNGSRTRSGIFTRDPEAKIRQGQFQQDSVRAGYFSTLGMTLLKGRDFSSTDHAKSQPVAIITASLARRLFGEQEAIGRRLGFNSIPDPVADMTVVGVVSDVAMNGVREEKPPLFFIPWEQGFRTVGYVAVRVEQASPALVSRLRAVLAQEEPGVVFTRWQTLEERIDDELGGSRATAHIARALAAVSLLLAAVGTTTSLAYLVALRRRDLALRMALGADPRQVRGSVLRQAWWLGVIGTGLGLAALWVLPAFPGMAEFVPDRPGVEAIVLTAVVAWLTTSLAGWFPARRATQADPLQLLKAD